MAGGPPSPAKRSFADVLGASASDASSSFIKRPSLHRGEPALTFTKDEVLQMSSSLKFALVGKFSRGRPPMAQLRKSFSTLDLKGSYHLGLLNSRHVLIRVDLEEDFLRLRLRSILSFDGFPMRLFRWTPQFRLDVESTWVPIWVRFDGLPIYMFNKGTLFSLGSILGDPLKIDASTSSLSRPSTARICVDIDIQKPRPPRIWLEDGERGFWQTVDYEDVPPLCSVCSKIGHLGEKCNLRESAKISSTKQLWVPKPTAIPKNAEAATSVPKILTADVVTVNQRANPLTSNIKLISPPMVNSAAADVLPVAAISSVLNSIRSDPSVAAILASSEDQPVLSHNSPVAAVQHLSPDVVPAAVAATEVSSATDSAVVSAAAPVSAAGCSYSDAAAAFLASSEDQPVVILSHNSLPVAAVQHLVPDVVPAAVAATEVSRATPESAVDSTAAPVSAAGCSYSDDPTLQPHLVLNPVAHVQTQMMATAVLNAEVLIEVQAPSIRGVLNPNAPLFNPRVIPYAESSKSFAEALLGDQPIPLVSMKPRFIAAKSAEFPLFQLPQFGDFYPPSSSIPRDDPDSLPSRVDIYVFSDGDDVPRLPSSRQLLLASLQSFNKKLQTKFRKRQKFLYSPTTRKKWKKLPPISMTGPSLSSRIPPPFNAFSTFYGPNPNEEQSDDDTMVAYDNVWRSSSSDDENPIDFDYPLASYEALMALEYEDFSLSPPRRRKYNKRFRDLPPALPTRRSKPRD